MVCYFIQVMGSNPMIEFTQTENFFTFLKSYKSPYMVVPIMWPQEVKRESCDRYT